MISLPSSPKGSPSTGSPSTGSPSEPRQGEPWGRLRAALSSLASPLGILVTLPALVLCVGAFLTILGQRNLRVVVDSMSRDRFFEQTSTAARRTLDILQQASPVMERWKAFVLRHKGKPPEKQMAHHLADMIYHRPGLSWMSFSTDSGYFRGLFRNTKGHLIYTARNMRRGHPTERWDYRILSQRLKLVAHKTTGYDHRVRAWYKLIKSNKRPTWTKPYVFYSSGVPGITYAEPYWEKGRVHGVFTVDFMLNELSAFVEKLNANPKGRVFMFTSERVLLAYPGIRRRLGFNRKGKGKLLHASKHPNARLRAFFEHPKSQKLAGKEPIYFEFGGEGERAFGSIFPCPIAPGLTWYVGAFLPQAAYLKPVEEHRIAALRLSFYFLLVALLLASLLAWHVSRSREDLTLAQAQTRAARKEAMALGSYTLVEKLGGGGMGEVWKGEHQMLARPAAIKLVRAEVLQNEAYDADTIVARFQREAHATASLSSPHTVRLYDFGMSSEGLLFYVMELLEGLDLRELVFRDGPQPPGRVVHILKQICLSLAEAHDKGLIHRDLKPANIFLCGQGIERDFVKVLDFGIVLTATDEREGSPVMVGTPAFMSPEQIQARGGIDHRADIYALGCLAYWMLTARRVFHRETLKELLEAHLHAPPDPPSRHAPFPMPQELEELVLSCLAKPAEQRPPDAQYLYHWLHDIQIPDRHSRWDLPAIDQWWDAFSDSQEGPLPTIEPEESLVMAHSLVEISVLSDQGWGPQRPSSSATLPGLIRESVVQAGAQIHPIFEPDATETSKP